MGIFEEEKENVDPSQEKIETPSACTKKEDEVTDGKQGGKTRTVVAVKMESERFKR